MQDALAETIPGAGQIYSAGKSVTGYNPITGKPLGLWEVGLGLLGAVTGVGDDALRAGRGGLKRISDDVAGTAADASKRVGKGAPKGTVVGGGFDAKGILPRNGTRTVLNQGPHPTCGPTSCGMILDDIAGGRLSTNVAGYNGVGPKGIAIDDLLPILNNNGVKASYKSGLTIDALKAATAKGNPAIVAIRTPRGGHAVVVDGITTRLGKQVVAIRNPWGTQYFQTVEEFRKVFLRQGILTGN